MAIAAAAPSNNAEPQLLNSGNRIGPPAAAASATRRARNSAHMASTRSARSPNPTASGQRLDQPLLLEGPWAGRALHLLRQVAHERRPRKSLRVAQRGVAAARPSHARQHRHLQAKHQRTAAPQEHAEPPAGGPSTHSE